MSSCTSGGAILGSLVQEILGCTSRSSGRSTRIPCEMLMDDVRQTVEYVLPQGAGDLIESPSFHVASDVPAVLRVTAEPCGHASHRPLLPLLPVGSAAFSSQATVQLHVRPKFPSCEVPFVQFPLAPTGGQPMRGEVILPPSASRKTQPPHVAQTVFLVPVCLCKAWDDALCPVLKREGPSDARVLSLQAYQVN